MLHYCKSKAEAGSISYNSKHVRQNIDYSLSHPVLHCVVHRLRPQVVFFANYPIMSIGHNVDGVHCFLHTRQLGKPMEHHPLCDGQTIYFRRN